MSKARILIADDEEGIRDSLTLILSNDYELVCAKDGEEALAQLRKERFNLAILDIKMPKLDGLELMKKLREERISLTVLILTAYQSVELAKEAVKMGAIEYLPKPFSREVLLSAVSGSLNKRR